MITATELPMKIKFKHILKEGVVSYLFTLKLTPLTTTQVASVRASHTLLAPSVFAIFGLVVVTSEFSNRIIIFVVVVAVEGSECVTTDVGLIYANVCVAFLSVSLSLSLSRTLHWRFILSNIISLHILICHQRDL